MSSLAEQIGLALARGFLRGALGGVLADRRPVSSPRRLRRARTATVAPRSVSNCGPSVVSMTTVQPPSAEVVAMRPAEAPPAEIAAAADDLVADLAGARVPRAVQGHLEPCRWSKPCRAQSAQTGRMCALLAGHSGPHAHGRVTFVQVAAPGQTHFAGRDELELRAFARPEALIEDGPTWSERRNQQNRNSRQRSEQQRREQVAAEGGESNG